MAFRGCVAFLNILKISVFLADSYSSENCCKNVILAKSPKFLISNDSRDYSEVFLMVLTIWSTAEMLLCWVHCLLTIIHPFRWDIPTQILSHNLESAYLEHLVLTVWNWYVRLTLISYFDRDKCSWYIYVYFCLFKDLSTFIRWWCWWSKCGKHTQFTEASSLF